MPHAAWLEGLITVGVGAVSGGITNAVAVWMLFHPYEPRGVGPLRLQGAIPKNRARLARSIARAVGQRLLTEDDLARQLGAPELRAAFERAVAEFVARALRTPRGALRDEEARAPDWETIRRLLEASYRDLLVSLTTETAN